MTDQTNKKELKSIARFYKDASEGFATNDGYYAVPIMGTSTKLDISTKPTRTRRSRKSAAKVTPTPKTVVVKEVQEIAPPAPKLTLADYREDILARVRIHNYEVNMLVKDVQKGYDFVLPFGKKAYNYVSGLIAE